MSISQFTRRLGWPLVVVLVSLAAGCEQSEETLGVDPSFVEISDSSNTVQFTVTGEATNATFVTPITWSVVNPALGQIVGSHGLSALYMGVSGAVGDNIVVARDNLGNEGYATVRRIAEVDPAEENEDATAAAAPAAAAAEADDAAAGPAD